MTTRGTRIQGAFGVLSIVALVGCKHDRTDPSATTITSAAVEPEGPTAEISKTAKLAAIAMQTNVYARPNDTSKKVGYLRLGAIVARSDKAYGSEGCPGGWYGVAPRGFVCVGKNAALETGATIAPSRR